MGNIVLFIKKLFNKPTLFESLTKQYYNEKYFVDLADSHVIYLIFVGFLSGDKLIKKNTGKYVVKFGKSESFVKRIKAHRKTFDAYCNVLFVGDTISATQVELHIKRHMRSINRLISLDNYGTELLIFESESEFNSIKNFITDSIKTIKNKTHKQIDKRYHIGSPWL